MNQNFPLILLPAYGRKYASEEAAIYDWEAGKDFRIEDGPYCSIRDLEEMRKEFPVISIRVAPGIYCRV